MLRISLFFLASLLLAPSLLFGLGGDHNPGDLPINSAWTKGAYEILNRSSRVHGFWINSSDTLYYKGSNQELQEMILQLTKLQGTEIESILHAGKGLAQSPWSKKPVDDADWCIVVSGEKALSETQSHFTVHVWLSGSISLDELVLPKTLKVTSAREIDSYIKKHTATP